MKKFFKKFIVFAISFLSILSCFTPVAVKLAGAETDSSGLNVRKTDDYEMETALSQIPFTIETTFEITSEQVKASGTQIIVGNWGNENASFRLLINDLGKPTLYVHRNNETGKINGSSVNNNEYYTACNVAYDVRDKGKVHLVITTNGDGAWWCYINGQAGSITGWRQKIDTTLPVTLKARVGASTNYVAAYQDYYFRGTIYSLALYSDQRTAAEVAATYQNGIDATDSGLMVAYDFTGAVKGQLSFQDLSSSGNDLKMPSWTWTTTSQYNPDDYAFSFMVVGDTQIASKRSVIDFGSGTGDNAIPQGTVTYMDMIYDYIVENVEKKKVKHVLGLGDITEYNAYNEWALAQRAISKMNGVVPYSLVPGNHDVTNWFVKNNGGTGINVNANLTDIAPYFSYHMQDGQIRPVTEETTYTLDSSTTINYYNTFFGEKSSYAEQYAYSYVNTNASASTRNASTVHFFTGTDNLEYMVVALEYGPTDDTLAWASDIIEKHPNHNVIVTTHGYMAESTKYLVAGNTNGAAANTGMLPTAGANSTKANCGDEMWTEFVSQHKNISMLLCGHVESDIIVYRQDKGVNGNVVTQMLCNPQLVDIRDKGQPLYEADSTNPSNLLTGMVATYYVKADGKTIDVEWYSPIQKAYFKESGQFRFTANVVEYPRVIASVEGGHGMVTPTRQDLTSEPTVVTFTPDRGYQIKSVIANGEDVTAQVVDNKLTFTAEDGYQIIVVEYEEGTYLLKMENDDLKGDVNLSKPANHRYRMGEEITFTIAPKEYYYVHRVRFNGDVIYDENGTYKINVQDRENTIQVEYRTEGTIHSLTVVNDVVKGTVSTLESDYEVGEEVSFTVTPVGENTVKEVRFNGRVVTVENGTYTVTIVATDNILEVVYNEIVVIPSAPTYSLEVVNDTSKGSLVGTFEEEYEVGEEVSFTVTPVGENTVKEVRFNGRVVTAENGTYTVTIVATDNILEVVYNVPEAVGCNSSLSSMMSCVIAVCGLAVVLKKREN